MSVVSYRIRCDDCENEEVIRESEFEETLWKIGSAHNHSGLCPECNPAVTEENIEAARESREDDDEDVAFEEIDGVGKSTASELRRIGIETKGDVRRASVAKLTEVSGVGESKANGIKEYI